MACINCIKYKSDWGHDDKDRYVLLSRNCEKGFQSEMEKWWKDNGTKTNDGDIQTLDCIEHSEGYKILLKMSDIIDEITQKLTNPKEG